MGHWSEEVVEMERSRENLSEVGGGSLIGGTSVFAEIERGLIRNAEGIALQCIQQDANHFSRFLGPFGEKVESRNGDASTCLTLTYSQLHRAAFKLAAGLQAHGIRSGSTILLLIPNGGEFGLWLWTGALARVTLSWVETSVLDLSNLAALQRMIEALAPSVVVVSDEDGALCVDRAIQELEIQQPLRVCLYSTLGWTRFSDLAVSSPDVLVNEAEMVRKARDNDPQRIHSILFTSGTSAGQPKGCPQSTSSMVHFLHSQGWLIHANNCQRVIVQAHNSRAIAPALVLQTWREGGTVIMPNVSPRTSFAIEHTVSGILRDRATFVVLSPSMLPILEKQFASDSRPRDSVRSIQLGGDTVTRDALQKCTSLFPKASVCINHGMSEGGAFFTWPFSGQPVSSIPFFGEVCPIGTVAPGARVRIWNAERREVAQRGEPGELHASCKTMIAHYLGGVHEDAFYDDATGRWFITGDLAMMDAQGLVFIIGRSKDVIRRSGISLMPVALESCIEKYCATQAAVVPITHAKLGQNPYVVLGSLRGRSEADIQAHVIHSLGESYALGGAVTLAQLGLEKMPVNATFKVMKGELQTRVEAYLRSTAPGMSMSNGTA